jgi:vacuolar iron transporter family protein
MKNIIKKSIGFGLTSAIITTLGVMVGLNSTTGSRTVVIGGILTIAIADAMSDAFGIHISEESITKNSNKKVWWSTIITFFAKFFFALTFMIPVLLLELQTAVIISIIWGLLLIVIFTYYITRKNKLDLTKAITEHVSIAILVIIITHFLGKFVLNFFG